MRPAPSLDYATPAHGDRVFGVGEADHTPFDLRLVSSVTGEVLGTAYLSLLVDACTCMPLAFVLRFGTQALLDGVAATQRPVAAATTDEHHDDTEAAFALARFEAFAVARPDAAMLLSAVRAWTLDTSERIIAYAAFSEGWAAATMP